MTDKSFILLLLNLVSTIYRTLSNFATEGIVGLNGKKIKIIDKEKLEQINNQG